MPQSPASAPNLGYSGAETNTGGRMLKIIAGYLHNFAHITAVVHYFPESLALLTWQLVQHTAAARNDAPEAQHRLAPAVHGG
jgi:hypothetical protein